MTTEAKAEVVRQAHEHRVRHQALAEDAHRLEAEVPPIHQPPEMKCVEAFIRIPASATRVC